MIEVKNLTKTYKTGNKALKGINIQIQDGEFVSLWDEAVPANRRF